MTAIMLHTYTKRTIYLAFRHPLGHWCAKKEIHIEETPKKPSNLILLFAASVELLFSAWGNLTLEAFFAPPPKHDQMQR